MMDIRFINLQESIPREYQKTVVSSVLELLNSEPVFISTNGKLMHTFRLEYYLQPTLTLLHTINVTVVQNKTCYTIYSSFVKPSKQTVDTICQEGSSS
jgi:hypothetical protein